jgi:hypothetical protein
MHSDVPGTQMVVSSHALGSVWISVENLDSAVQWRTRLSAFRTFRDSRTMSLLDDFARMRLYRDRASEYELLAESELLPEARLRYRIIARHYRELADREQRSDKARMAEHLELLKLKRREAAE